MTVSSSPDEGEGREADDPRKPWGGNGELLSLSLSSVFCSRGWQMVERPVLSQRRLAAGSLQGVVTWGCPDEGEAGAGGGPVKCPTGLGAEKPVDEEVAAVAGGALAGLEGLMTGGASSSDLMMIGADLVRHSFPFLFQHLLYDEMKY